MSWINDYYNNLELQRLNIYEPKTPLVMFGKADNLPVPQPYYECEQCGGNNKMHKRFKSQRALNIHIGKAH